MGGGCLAEDGALLPVKRRPLRLVRLPAALGALIDQVVARELQRSQLSLGQRPRRRRLEPIKLRTLLRRDPRGSRRPLQRIEPGESAGGLLLHRIERIERRAAKHFLRQVIAAQPPARPCWRHRQLRLRLARPLLARLLVGAHVGGRLLETDAHQISLVALHVGQTLLLVLAQAGAVRCCHRLASAAAGLLRCVGALSRRRWHLSSCVAGLLQRCLIQLRFLPLRGHGRRWRSAVPQRCQRRRIDRHRDVVAKGTN